MKYLCLLFFSLGCSSKSSSSGPCYSLCQELVQTCGYAAYPTFSSCEEGCAYYQEEGADIEGQLTCVQEAECSEFTVIECEHQYGVGNEGE